LKGSDKPLTRIACARVLARVGTKESLPALEEVAKDTSPRNRQVASEATKAIEAIKKR
jgi:HEAT repeat protein